LAYKKLANVNFQGQAAAAATALLEAWTGKANILACPPIPLVGTADLRSCVCMAIPML
jgi:hypothetical protein